jgi:DNA-binding LytR/AlgR family response regulator
MLTVAICDDEPLALDRLRRMLDGLADVVATFISGEELLARFEGGADALLLDVEMPKVDGFDVVEALSRREWSESEAPLIIFVTAHSKAAVDAFDSGAIDFLTKPVRLSRLERALERARDALENRQARRRLDELAGQIETLKQAHSTALDEPDLWLRKGPTLVRMEPSDIDWISAEGECVRFHSGKESFLERQAIREVAERLEPFGFVRIHRSAVVNADRIQSVSRTRWGSLEVRLRGGTQLRVSKSYQPAIRALMSRREPC